MKRQGRWELPGIVSDQMLGTSPVSSRGALTAIQSCKTRKLADPSSLLHLGRPVFPPQVGRQGRNLDKPQGSQGTMKSVWPRILRQGGRLIPT